ncbi:uncharacterized protein LOC124153221 [Ischnura elegans]|uniref:uncharacterized protein LOC124153221 n=1 Tax=Ischnura elegans TaxID=197161 RepID=UPI001ED8B612|nr:uncharacterized protein LOC124153221 [Ischnura elegans]
MVITFSHIICSHISTTYHSVFVSKASRRRALLEGGLVDSELHSLSVFLAMARKGLSHEELLAALQDISGNESGSDCGLGEDSDSSSDEEPFLLTNHSIPSSESDSDVPDTRLEDSSAPPQQDLRKNTIEHEKRKLLEGSRGRAVRGSRGRRGIGAVRRATSLRGHLKSRGSRGGYVMTTALDTTDSQMCLPRGKESEGENGIDCRYEQNLPKCKLLIEARKKGSEFGYINLDRSPHPPSSPSRSLAGTFGDGACPPPVRIGG